MLPPTLSRSANITSFCVTQLSADNQLNFLVAITHTRLRAVRESLSSHLATFCTLKNENVDYIMSYVTLMHYLLFDILVRVKQYCYTALYQVYTVSQKSHPFYFRDNFPYCKPLQIIFGRNTAEKIWNRLIYDNFDILSLCVASLIVK